MMEKRGRLTMEMWRRRSINTRGAHRGTRQEREVKGNAQEKNVGEDLVSE